MIARWAELEGEAIAFAVRSQFVGSGVVHEYKIHGDTFVLEPSDGRFECRCNSGCTE
eukprot:NODE_703_length_1847_cov_613.282536_g572_i0.p9 GENE.NODE_703_length_1847_cov_613.282536_g572_i0~~NODE_703_length_1847_cov_613.282536_g572_i0.p9  ORF type:complete len:57 (-),score=1.10 NODE_703_length_1847_cov_613.282536_g572_i0:1085-1255(-)